jgi:hypothetical protein
MQDLAHTSATAAPLQDVDWINGRAIEIFFVDYELAHALGGSPGWYWWACYPGCLPNGDAFGPFPTSFRALKDAIEAGRVGATCPRALPSA